MAQDKKPRTLFTGLSNTAFRLFQDVVADVTHAELGADSHIKPLSSLPHPRPLSPKVEKISRDVIESVLIKELSSQLTISEADAKLILNSQDVSLPEEKIKKDVKWLGRNSTE
jgi:hypothetical protein